MPSTVYTVAEKAGVSIATVSRVINNSAKVHPRTRDKVMKVIEELDYHPNLSAQGLALNITEIIALIFPDISGPFYSEVLRGVEKEASQHDYNLLIYGTHGKESNPRFLRRLPGRVDGMILMTRSVDDQYIFDLSRKGIPFVLLDRETDGVIADCILSNNVDAAVQATEHLIQHGHQRIAFISGPIDSPDSNARFTGYQQALEKHGLLVLHSLVERGDFRRHGARGLVGAVAGTQPVAREGAHALLQQHQLGRQGEIGHRSPRVARAYPSARGRRHAERVGRRTR